MAALDALHQALGLDAMSLDMSLGELEAGLEVFMGQDTEWRHCQQALPELAYEWRALAILASLGYGVLRPCLRDSTASGTLLKRRLEPLYQSLAPWLKLLQ